MDDMPLTQDFRTAVKRLLRERHMSQRDLARLLGIKDSPISQLLNGEYQPSMEQCEKVAAALNMRVILTLVPADSGVQIQEFAQT
jgi:transcriptional regulator with XRE-family HTH domain